MGRMLDALKHIEDQGDLFTPGWSMAAAPSATVDQTSSVDHPEAVEPDQQEPLAPCYREIVSAVLSQLKVRENIVMLIAGFRDDEARGGQLAALYPILASQIDGGLVVIDANTRNAGLKEHLLLQPGQGLAEVLTGQATWENAVCKTEHPGLYVIPSTEQRDPLSKDNEEQTVQKKSLTHFFPVDIAPLLSKAKTAHRLVIIDTMLDTAKDMANWAAISDATILVARLEVTPRRLIRRAIHAIQARGSQILGCILLEA